MKFRALLNILISYVLLFPAGVVNVRADTISHPVSVAVPTGMNGEMNSKPVSVAVPTSINGEMNSKPVSVAIPEGTYGSMSTKPVSVSWPVTAADGTYMGKPVTLAVNPENQGDPDLVGLWHMDGDWGDSSGNNNNGAPINGPAFSTDMRVGTQSASLNGSSSFIQVADNASLDLASTMTLEAWIKPNDIGNYRQIISKFGSAGNYAYQFGLAPSGNLRVDISGNGTAYDNLITTTAPILVNAWNHVAATFNAGILNLYVNGTQAVQTKTSTITALKVSTIPFNIGRDPSGVQYFNGLIDEVAIYKRVLTAEEIAFHANARPGDPAAPPSPVLDPVPSVVGTSTINLSGSKTIGTSIWVNNKKIAPLDNMEIWEGIYGTLQPGANLLNVIAVDATFKQSLPVLKPVIYDNMPPVIEGTYPANNSDTAKPVTAVTINLVDTYAGIDLDQSIVGATVKNSANHAVSGSWMKSGAKTIIFTPSTSPLPSDSYLVTVYPTDAVGNKGQQQIVFTTHDISAPVTTLSVKEIKGKDGWYYSAVTITLTASDGSEGSGIAKTEYSFDGTSWSTYASPFGMDTDGVNTLYYRSTDKSGNVEATKSNEIKINKTGLVGLWHMDNDWQDSSVVGHAGTVNGAIFSPSAKIGTYAGSFDGANDRVTITDSAVFQAMQNIAVEAWINPGRIASGTRQTIFSFKEGDNPNVGAVLALPEDATNKVRFWVQVNGVWQSATNTTVVSPSNWYHVVGTYDGASINIYVNGTLEGQTAALGTMTNAVGSATSTITIGARASNNTHWYQGLIDELAIYNRPLSVLEIQEHYRSYSIQSPTVDPVPSPTTVAEITLSGTKPANTALVVNGTTVVPLDGQTAWQGAYTLQPGMNNLSVSAMDADGFHSQAVLVPVALDIAAPAVTSTSPVNNGVFNTAVPNVVFNLTDAFSAIDLAATYADASVRSGSGLNVPGAWSASGTGLTGSVTFTPDFTLNEGTYTAAITPTDALGNHSTHTITFTVDATPPPVPTIDPILVPSRTTTKTITGTKSLDTAAVIVACTGATVGAVSYPTSLTWSVTVSGLHEGSNTVTAYAVDGAMNPSSSTQMTFTVDTLPPAAPVVDPPSTPTKQSSITLTGTKEAGSYLFVNNVKTGAAYADTVWSYPVNLTSEGNNAFVLFAQDEAGNPSTSATVNVVRDTTGPRISTTTPSFNAFINHLGSVDIILVDDNSAVDLQESIKNNEVKHSSNTVISGSWTTQAGGHIIFTPNAGTVLSDGVYTVTIKPVDILGNTVTLTFSFTLDNGLPTVQSLTMNPLSPHKAETVSFSVTFSEDMLITVPPSVSFKGECLLCFTSTPITSGNWANNRTWTGSYLFTSGTGDGSYAVTIADAKDKAGNVMASHSIASAFVLDTTAPAAPGIDPVTTPTNVRNQVLKGAREAYAELWINGSRRLSSDPSPATTTTWTYSMPLTEGTNTLTITARDAAGNDSAPSIATIMVDSTPPVFTVNPYSNPSATATQTLTGTKEPNCVVKVNNTQIYSTLDSNPTWTYTVTLTSGITNRFVFTAADTLGNTTTRTVDILFDNAPPAALGLGVLTADGSGNGTEVTLSWAAYPETTDVGYYSIFRSSVAFTDVAGMTSIGTVNKGAKTYKATGLTQGSTYYFAVVPVDQAGNQINTVNIASAVPTDTKAPEEVTNLAATAGYTGAQGNFITITWNPSANTMGDLADQIVYVDSGTGYDIGTPLGKTATTFTKTGLVDATKYKFKLMVKDTLGHESQGVIIEAMTRLANPVNLAATTTSGKATLSWSAVSSTYASYVKQYNIYRKTSTAQQTDIGMMTLIGTVARTVTTYNDTGLTNDTTYQYAVTVLNTSGAERTDAQSISAAPRADSTGPVIDTFSIINGQVVTAPITITATAHDGESAMGSMELSVDGTIVATQTSGSMSYFWNVVASTDGNHAIKLRALDSKGNATEDPRQVIVSLAQPAMPAITGHSMTQTSPSYVVTATGTAPLFTTVTLKVNGVVVATSPSTSSSTFTFNSIALVEGDNVLAVKASHRGGESAYTPDYKILVDTGAPPAPQNLAGQVLPGGLIRFIWTNGAGELPMGYNLYVSSSSFSSRTAAGVTKTNTSSITYQYKEYNPGDDGLKYYAVTAVDSAGNESGISNVVAMSSDRTAPSVTSIQYTVDSIPVSSAVGPGSVTVAVTVSEPLKELPFFSLEPQEGSPIVVTMAKVDDTHYAGTFAITAQSPQGPTTYKFSGKDMIGNRGNAQGAGITIDVQGPVAVIQSPLTTMQIKPELVDVNLVLNEASVMTPTVTLKAADGTTTLASGMTSADNGIHWTGTLAGSGMPEGKAEFLLSGAQDSLGNIGTTVSSGRYLLFYRNGVPPPGIPEGLAAKSEIAGAVTLTWYPVANPNSDLSTLTYNLYRRAEGETAATKIKTGIAGSPAQDTPPIDGTYYYSVTSVGLLGSESPASAEVQAFSDRTGPPAPQNLALSLGSGGVTATWTEVVDINSELGTPNSALPLKGYHLYRSSAAFTSSSGLTPVSKTPIAAAVDTSPSKTYRFYAVAAVDGLGNEGPLSEVKSIDFPVSPVRNLALQRIDDAAPTLAWQAPQDGSIAGYHIYRNGSRITPYPVSDLSYTDGYAAVNTTYGVSAVDNLGNESPVKQVTLPDLTMGLKAGTALRRGVLETLTIILSAGQGSSFTIDTLDVKVGTAPSSSLLGPFTLGANSALQLEKVAATAADALSPVSVFIQANWSPSPGVSIKVSRTTSADVLGSSSSMEIFNDPLVRNTDAKVRIKVNNIGTSQMEIVTSENNTKTTKVRINLKDQDGNLLSTGYLDQRVGSSIVNGAGYAVARINPNENFLSEPILLPVPVSAPYKVIIEAVIENTYYHYAKTDQVTAPGMKGATESYIQETAYRATAAPEKAFYAVAQPVVITGSAISNTPSTQGGEGGGEGALVPNVAVKLGVSVRGFDRFYTVTTDAIGRFTYTFTPGSNEAGDYSIWAVHPDVKDRTVQATFSIAGFTINPGIANVRMARNRTQDIPVTLVNYGGGTLTGLAFETTASTGVTVGVINPGDAKLTAGENQGITFRITTESTAPDTAWATMTAKTAEGLSVKLNANITVVSLIPIISTSPSYIDTGMVRGDQKIATFTVSNTGQETLRNARIEGPSTSWMVPTVNKAIGDVAPGASTTVGFMFSPPVTLTQGVYDDQIVIYSDNHIPYTYHIQVTVASDAVGSVYFDVMSELMEKVPNAVITFQHQSLTELLYTIKTVADGTVMKYDIPEGRYVFNITASGHKGFSGSFVISPGLTTTVPIALEATLVNIEWTVTPVAIQDVYQITVTQTFQTNVPTPVLVSEPASITIPDLQPGGVFNGEYTVTNYGLIAANDVNIQYPTSFGDYDIEILATLPKTLNAMQRATIPYRITRRITTAMLPLPSLGKGTGEGIVFAANSELNTRNSQLFNEVKGYGASCGGSFNFTVTATAIICPGALNERTVTRTTTYTVVSSCPPQPGGGGGTPSTGGWVPGMPYGYGGGIGSQGGGGGLPGGSGAISTLPNDEGCIYPASPNSPPGPPPGPPDAPPGSPPGNPPDRTQCSGSMLDIPNGTYIFTETDLKVPAHFMPIEMSRTYRSNQIIQVGDNWQFAAPMDSPLGYGWHSPWFTRAGEGSYMDGEGNYYVFGKDSSGNYLPHAETGLLLKKTASGYEVSKRGGNTSVFNASGRLKAIRDKRGNTVTLNYDTDNRLLSVLDVTNREVFTFAYNAEDHISSVTDVAGRTVSYSYDSHGNMTTAVLAHPNAEPITLSSYEYDLTVYPLLPLYCIYKTYVSGGVTITEVICYTGAATLNQPNSYHNLIKKTNVAGESYQITYNAKWRNKGIVVTITDPSGRTMTNTPGFGSRVFYSTDYEGRKYKRVMNDKGKVTLFAEVDERSNTDQVIRKTEYIENRIEKTIDAMGNVTTVQKDEWDNIISRTDAAGNTTKYAYTLDGKLQTITDPLGTVTRFEYDEYGKRTKDIIAAGTSDESVTTYTYTQYSELATITKGAATTTYEYNAAGQVNKIIDPTGNSTTMTYDGAGNLITRTQPLIGDITYSGYDYRGNPARVIDPNGNMTTYTYDASGRVLTVKALGDTVPTQYVYVQAGCTTCGGGAVGKIDYIILPEGNKIDYDYDTNGNLTQIKDNDGNSINYNYDKYGNKTGESIKDASGTLQKTLGYQYDLLNRQTRIVNPDAMYTENGYDSRGNRISLKTPNSTLTTYEYDAVNRLVKVTQPGNVATTYTYDRRNNLTSVTDANGNSTHYAYNAQNRVTETDSPDTGSTTYTYDLNGNLKTKTDAKGVTISYTYDALNRLTLIDFPADTDIVYTYDTCLNGKGRLCGMADASGTTSYEYTPKGQIKKETKLIDSVNYVTQYTYDQNGNMRTMSYPSGKVITYNYSNDRAITVLNGAANLATNIAYKPFGGMSAITYGNGLTSSIGYDTQYRLSSLATGTFQNLTYGYDNNGNITSIAPGKNYTYDALDRLGTANGPWGSLGWTYDGVGNRQTENANTYTYTPNTNKLTSVNGISFGYDNNGNTSSEALRVYTYNQNQRLIKVTDGAAIKGEYSYNGNGQRVKKLIDGVTTIFHYNLNGQIISESSSAGTITAEYVYLNGQPLAKMEGKNTYNYHNDHLATPQKMTDSSGTVVWSADYKPFGEATVNPSSTITNNLRFPGQYYDVETGLNYNYMRDYNPTIGRYIESDPVGIQEGHNHLFVYAKNNALRFDDPFGLQSGGAGGIDSCEYYNDLCKKKTDCGKPGDPYACKVYQCCKDFGTGPKKDCVRKCLIDEDKSKCADLPTESQRQNCRLGAHYKCYTSCSFYPAPWTVPSSCWSIVMGS